MVGFHHFLFKVEIKQDGYTPALDKLAHSSLCCIVLTKGYSQYQSDSDLVSAALSGSYLHNANSHTWYYIASRPPVLCM